ncbi:8068_t:CDS:2, partial [Gigaspora rosea]
KAYNYYKIPRILHLKPDKYSSYLDALRNCAERKILKNCDNITYRYTDPKLIESVIEKVSTNIQKRIRVSPNEDVLDTNNDEQILNNHIFNVDQDEQE